MPSKILWISQVASCAGIMSAPAWNRGGKCSGMLSKFSFPYLQAGSKKFNRAKLLNVGYLEALKEENWDCFIFHDVDLVPENDFNLYTCEDQPKHLVVGRNSTGYR